MPKQFFYIESFVYKGLACILSILFLNLAWNCYYADSEIWLITLSEHLFSPNPPGAIYFKYFFHFLNKLVLFPTTTNTQSYYSLRMFFAIVGLGSALLQALFISRWFEKRSLFVPVFLFILTSSLFFNQAFRVRADILSLFIYSLILLLVASWSQFSWLRCLALSLLHTALLFCTPKGFIWSLILILWALLLNSRTYKKEDIARSRLLLLSFFLPLQILISGFCLLMIFKTESVIFQSLRAAFDFYLKSFSSDYGGADFLKTSDFMYVFRFITLNPAHTIVFVSWLLSFLINAVTSAHQDKRHHPFQTLTAILVCAVLLYNQKLPFFLAAFLVPVWAWQFALFYDACQKRPLTQWMPLLLILGSSVLCFKQYRYNLFYNNNQDQMQFVQNLEMYKAQHPSTSIYDVVGLLPKNNSYFLFVGPGDVSRKADLFSEIQSHPPDVYLYTFKNTFFEPQLKPFLQKNYLEIHPGFWLRAQHIDLTQEPLPPIDVIQWKNQPYWLFKTSSATVIDKDTQKNISNMCLFLSETKVVVTPDKASWVAVPLQFLRLSFVSAPLPDFEAKNPFILFRFDTAF